MNESDRGGARPLSSLHAGDSVRVQDAKTSGTVVGLTDTPRLYLVKTLTSCLRINQRHLVPTPNVTSTVEPVGDDVLITDDVPTTPVQPRVMEPRLTSPRMVNAAVAPPPGGVVTRPGRVSVPPQLLNL